MCAAFSRMQRIRCRAHTQSNSMCNCVAVKYPRDSQPNGNELTKIQQTDLRRSPWYNTNNVNSANKTYLDVRVDHGLNGERPLDSFTCSLNSIDNNNGHHTVTKRKCRKAAFSVPFLLVYLTHSIPHPFASHECTQHAHRSLFITYMCVRREQLWQTNEFVHASDHLVKI